MTLALVACIFAPFIAMLVIWKFVFIARIKSVKGGFKEDVTIPHTESVELYFADVSACSMKVRFCLAAAGVKYKQNVMKLPSAGSWETRSSEFLRINPAATVPVLVHNGHPIHESTDQIEYIARNLVPTGGIELEPTDPVRKRVNDYWLEKTSWYPSEMLTDINKALAERVGNCIPFLTMPCFAAIIEMLSWKSICHGILIGGINDKQAFNVIFAFLGVHAFKKIPILPKLVKKGRSAMYEHLRELEKFLQEKDSKFIGGDNVILADIGWGKILARMDYADWWDCIDPKLYPYVTRYWDNMRALPAYQEATTHVLVPEEHSLNVRAKLKQWKEEYQWFRHMYE